MVVHWNLISKTSQFLKQLCSIYTSTAIRSCMIRSGEQILSTKLSESLVRKEVYHDK